MAPALPGSSAIRIVDWTVKVSGRSRDTSRPPPNPTSERRRTSHLKRRTAERYRTSGEVRGPPLAPDIGDEPPPNPEGFAGKLPESGARFEVIGPARIGKRLAAATS